MKEYTCHQCGDEQQWFNEGTITRCRNCGQTHTLDRKRIVPVSPAMYPIGTADCILSPWMLPWTRPVRPGRYDIRTQGGVHGTVEWDGHDDNWPVVMTWRGAWRK